MNANQVTGETGSRMYGEFDLGSSLKQAHGYHNQALTTVRAVDTEWREMLVTDITVRPGNTDLLVQHIVADGYKLTHSCRYNRKGNITYVRIRRMEYRMTGVKIYRKRIIDIIKRLEGL